MQDLQDLHRFAPLQSQNLAKNRVEKSAKFAKIQQQFAIVAKFANICQISKIPAEPGRTPAGRGTCAAARRCARNGAGTRESGRSLKNE